MTDPSSKSKGARGLVHKENVSQTLVLSKRLSTGLESVDSRGEGGRLG